ncbi:hypothetical protein B0H11DRAFT_323163 [Mycena galericulata]|nr:hypothetical protein B0H11DRAFT_323163 [Mycena galericulata]
MSYHDALPATLSTLEDVLHSVSVAPLELAAPRVVWRVYMRVTTHTADGYTAIRRAFRDVVFVTAFNNTGRVLREDVSCDICRAIDHPTPLCPFPDAPGWMGPTHTLLGPRWLDERRVHTHPRNVVVSLDRDSRWPCYHP